MQGALEWLPVSSEGVVAYVYALAFDAPLAESVGVALWLHIGTAISVSVAYRRDALAIARDALSRPLAPTPLVVFIVIGTAASAPIGLALLLGLSEFSERVGALAMSAIGALMVVAGGAQLRASARRSASHRSRRDLTWVDAALTGFAQGVAALPGMSRSGLTVSALLARRVDRREALALSFLLSVPASAVAGAYVALTGSVEVSFEALFALAVSAAVGVATIRALATLARRLRFGWFVIAAGAGMAVGGAFIALA